MKAQDRVKRAALNKAINYLLEDPEKNSLKLMDMIDAVVPKDVFPSQRKAFRRELSQDSNWHQLINRVLNLNPEVRDDLVRTGIVDMNLMAWPKQEENRQKYQCNIPWAMLMDPTSACNLHCKGCWAADYGNQYNLSYDDLDSIITQANELGTHFFIYTGGEPLVRKKDVIALCAAHPDSIFMAFTNGTLIDEQFCQDMIRVKNFIPAISVEGNEETTDARRGEGTFGKVQRAMALLREHGLPFGASCCYTSQNAGKVASEEFVDWLVDQGALFEWIFTFMPVGKDSPVELMASAEQREALYHFVRDMRNKKPLFMMDFWNDGEFVGGCIAGGRRYLHINAAGDVEPCVFAHYSNVNIHDVTLLEAFQSPIFMAYYNNQPFNDNLLRPCPILDNPGALAELVEETGAKSTDYTAKEEARDLCAKCVDSAAEWAPVARRLWENEADPMNGIRNNPIQGTADSDLEKFERLQRPGRHEGDYRIVNLQTEDESFEKLSDFRKRASQEANDFEPNAASLKEITKERKMMNRTAPEKQAV
ncbi:radical SAM protein [Curtanaerobium respiraculi]|uniref:radical SAM protein n=1 Tax=Curtanaerobium respiraculi TaxID=2949669 RepID=UPI0024B37438|nr:radical SAM protein [Curtanaerobium respiraculi]